jgi:hypothetical protein
MSPVDAKFCAGGEDSREAPDDCIGAGDGSGSASGEGVGCTMTDGKPTDGTTTVGLGRTISGSSLLGSCKRGVEAGAGSASKLELGRVPVDPRAELEGADGGGTTSTGAEGTGAGDARWLPVPGSGSLLSGTGVTMIS